MNSLPVRILAAVLTFILGVGLLLAGGKDERGREK